MPKKTIEEREQEIEQEREQERWQEAEEKYLEMWRNFSSPQMMSCIRRRLHESEGEFSPSISWTTDETPDRWLVGLYTKMAGDPNQGEFCRNFDRAVGELISEKRGWEYEARINLLYLIGDANCKGALESLSKLVDSQFFKELDAPEEQRKALHYLLICDQHFLGTRNSVEWWLEQAKYLHPPYGAGIFMRLIDISPELAFDNFHKLVTRGEYIDDMASALPELVYKVGGVKKMYKLFRGVLPKLDKKIVGKLRQAVHDMGYKKL